MFRDQGVGLTGNDTCQTNSEFNPETHVKVEKENRLHKLVFWLLYVYGDVDMRAYTFTI